jgi:serine/threonine-protein kinase RsbW
VDWLLDGVPPGQGSARAMALLEDHLTHQLAGGLMEPVREVLGDEIGRVFDNAGGRLVHLNLSWHSQRPVLSVRLVDRPAGGSSADGQIHVGEPVPERYRDRVTSWRGEEVGRLQLPVVRDELATARPKAPTPAVDSVPHLDLSVSLPRESVSVPVVRRLAAQALRAFGVHEEDVEDVQLAITEACANVVDHAAETSSYEVRIDLAADRCAITVLDQGAGFELDDVPDRAEEHSERGRGLTLMRALVDNLAFRNEPRAGAEVHMVKVLRYDPASPLRRR